MANGATVTAHSGHPRLQRLLAITAAATCGMVTACAGVVQAQRPGEADFSRIHAGMPQARVRDLLGAPARVWAVRYHDQTVWSYRFGQRCQVFHVGITPQGVVEDTSYGPDPACERDGFFMGAGGGRGRSGP